MEAEQDFCPSLRTFERYGFKSCSYDKMSSKFQNSQTYCICYLWNNFSFVTCIRLGLDEIYVIVFCLEPCVFSKRRGIYITERRDTKITRILFKHSNLKHHEVLISVTLPFNDHFIISFYPNNLNRRIHFPATGNLSI